MTDEKYELNTLSIILVFKVKYKKGLHQTQKEVTRDSHTTQEDLVHVIVLIVSQEITSCK